MDKNNKLGVYIGRFVRFNEAEENLEFVYKVKKIQDIERTIPEYGIQRPYTEAQQVLAWTNSFEYSDPSIALTKANQIFEESSDCKYVETVNYDTIFPEITLAVARATIELAWKDDTKYTSLDSLIENNISLG